MLLKSSLQENKLSKMWHIDLECLPIFRGNIAQIFFPKIRAVRSIYDTHNIYNGFSIAFLVLLYTVYTLMTPIIYIALFLIKILFLFTKNRSVTWEMSPTISITVSLLKLCLFLRSVSWGMSPIIYIEVSRENLKNQKFGISSVSWGTSPIISIAVLLKNHNFDSVFNKIGVVGDVTDNIYNGVMSFFNLFSKNITYNGVMHVYRFAC